MFQIPAAVEVPRIPSPSQGCPDRHPPILPRSERGPKFN